MNNGLEMVGIEIFGTDLALGLRKRKLYTDLSTAGLPIRIEAEVAQI